MANEITWRLEHERIGRLLLHYAMPAVIGTMVNALYNIVDADIPYSVVPPGVRNAHRGGGCDACLHLSGTKGE